MAETVYVLFPQHYVSLLVGPFTCKLNQVLTLPVLLDYGLQNPMDLLYPLQLIRLPFDTFELKRDFVLISCTCTFGLFSKLFVKVRWKHYKPAWLFWPREKQRKCRNAQFGIT